jgi:hypothetical protein
MMKQSETALIADQILGPHRRRRFAIKLQQKLERGLESYVRLAYTTWSPGLDDKARAKLKQQVKDILTKARAGEGGDAELLRLINTSDKAREGADELRNDTEKEIEGLARRLPVFAWVKSVKGARELGLATIVGEAGPLDRYANPQKLWKRLGFAPYEGFAGSTWKRDSWRPRALTKQEWIDNPFSGERYALMVMLAEPIFRHQWIGKDKTEDGVGKPNGPYGEIYAARRAHTATTHPDWTDGHAKKDALRIMMKAYLRDLWCAWNGKPVQTKIPAVSVKSRQPATVAARVKKPKAAVQSKPKKQMKRKAKT